VCGMSKVKSLEEVWLIYRCVWLWYGRKERREKAKEKPCFIGSSIVRIVVIARNSVLFFFCFVQCVFTFSFLPFLVAFKFA